MSKGEPEVRVLGMPVSTKQSNKNCLDLPLHHQNRVDMAIERVHGGQLTFYDCFKALLTL